MNLILSLGLSSSVDPKKKAPNLNDSADKAPESPRTTAYSKLVSLRRQISSVGSDVSGAAQSRAGHDRKDIKKQLMSKAGA